MTGLNPKPESQFSGKAILLFDGVCNSCNFVVNFLLKYDKNELFLFAPMQSKIGLKLLNQQGQSLRNLDTLVLLANGKIYTFSSAVFQIFKLLGFPWSLILIFSCLPESVTDLLYKSFSSNRYRLFGKSTVCRMPTAEEKRRFLDGSDPL